MTILPPPDDATRPPPLNEKGGKIVLLSGFFIFAFVLPLAFASQNSFLRNDLVALNQRVATGLALGMWIFLWIGATISVIKKPELGRKGLRLLAAPLVSMLVSPILGVIALLTGYLIGNASVTVTADQPHRSAAKILSISRTRGCQSKITFYESSVNREVHICGDQFLSKPKVGEIILVDKKISPWGVQITWVKQMARTKGIEQ